MEVMNSDENEIDTKEMKGAAKEDIEERIEEKPEDKSDEIKVIMYTLIVFIIIVLIIGAIAITNIINTSPGVEYPDYDNYTREEQDIIDNGTSLTQITYKNEDLNVFIIEVQFDNYSLHKAGWFNVNGSVTDTIYIKSSEELYLYIKIFYSSILSEEQLSWFNALCLIVLR